MNFIRLFASFTLKLQPQFPVTNELIVNCECYVTVATQIHANPPLVCHIVAVADNSTETIGSAFTRHEVSAKKRFGLTNILHAAHIGIMAYLFSTLFDKVIVSVA